jgi:poly(3-hydroxybutyrate) depolymerase
MFWMRRLVWMMKPVPFRRVAVSLVATILVLVQDVSVAAGQSEELPTGQVIERVTCKNKPEQTYALYLPTNYSSTRTWSLLAAFDPAARGNIPVERFQEAADKYGYIVCGSNNSRNGPWAPTVEAADAMLNDVTTRFPVDEKRVYLTGFSGGARVAVQVASMLRGRIAGVIGCGAGLPASLEPSGSLSFVYFGTVGMEDFNYPEMMQLDRSLEAAGLTHRIARFEGGHSWAPAELCSTAIEWMELQAMKAGTRTRDETLLRQLFKKAVDAANADEAAGRAYDAFIAWTAISRDFNELLDTTEATKKLEALRDTKGVKQATKLDRDQENEQRRRIGELFGLRARLRSSETANALTAADSTAQLDGSSRVGSPTGATQDEVASRQSTISELRIRLADLRKKANAKENTPERTLARRILNDFTASEFEPAMMLIRAGQYGLAIESLSLDVALMPDSAGFLYNLACAYALKGDKKRAIDTLDKAIQKGFANSTELETNHQLDSIRDEPAFKKLYDGIKQKQ